MVISGIIEVIKDGDSFETLKEIIRYRLSQNNPVRTLSYGA